MLTDLTERLETTGAAETLVRLVGADDQTTCGLSQEQMAWLTETDILEILLHKYPPPPGTNFRLSREEMAWLSEIELLGILLHESLPPSGTISSVSREEMAWLSAIDLLGILLHEYPPPPLRNQFQGIVGGDGVALRDRHPGNLAAQATAYHLPVNLGLIAFTVSSRCAS